jgi:hypothetical protein
MSYDQLTTRDYERVADASRRRLASSLDDLSRSLTPGRVLDEVMTYARGGGTDFFRGLGKAASANPIPTLLVSVGTMMFLSGRSGLDRTPRKGSSSRPNVGDDAHGAATGVRHGAGEFGSSVSDATHRAGDAIASAGSTVAGKVGEAADTLKSVAATGADKAKSAFDAGATAVGDAVSETGRLASDAAETVTERAAYVRDETGALFQDLAQSATKLAREQPLLVAAAGLAVGAMVAALLPRTETEDAYLGEASDAVKGAVGDVAGEQYERAKSVASNVVEEVKTAAEREGLTPEAAADAVRDLGDRVKTVVGEVASKSE